MGDFRLFCIFINIYAENIFVFKQLANRCHVKMNYIIILALIFTGVCSINAQNLIPDPGFEEVEFIFDGKDTVYVYTHWQSLLPFRKITHFGHPKFSKYQKHTNSEKALDAWKPYEGDSQFIAQHLNHKNLYQTKISHPLKVGKSYKLTMMYRVLAYMIEKNQAVAFVQNKIGGRFTVNDLCTKENQENFLSNTFKYPPHFSISDIHPDSLFRWIKYEYDFVADRPYQYLILGNFIPIVKTEVEAAHPAKGVSYRIDMVSLEEVNTFDSQNVLLEISQNFDELIDAVELKGFNVIAQIDSMSSAYYQWIFKAESFIIESKPDSAMMVYIHAFDHKKPLFREYRNVKTLQKKGDISDTMFITRLLDQISMPESKLSEISQKIDSIFRLDQDVRSTNFANFGSQDSANFLFLLSLADEKTISEQTIGINGMRNLEVILLHLSRYAFFDELIPVLTKQVEKGNFDNRQFASLVDSYYSNVISGDIFETYYYTTSAYPIFTQFVIPELDPDSIKLINERRNLIGLESLESQYRKQYYNFKYGYRDYEFYQFFTFFPAEEFCTEEEKTLYLEKEKELVEELRQKYRNLTIWSK
jgi:hypothetical protein